MEPLRKRIVGEVMQAVSDASFDMGMDVTLDEMRSASRVRRIVLTKQATVILLRRQGFRWCEMVVALKCDHATAIHRNKYGTMYAEREPVMGNLIHRACMHMSINSGMSLNLRAPEFAAVNPHQAKKTCKRSIRTSRDIYRCPRPWMDETSRTIKAWDRRPPVPPKRVRVIEESFIPVEWTTEERHRLAAWRRDTQGAMPTLSGGPLSISGTGRRRSKMATSDSKQR